MGWQYWKWSLKDNHVSILMSLLRIKVVSEVECSIPPDFSVKQNFCSLEVDVMGGKQDKWKHSDFDK